MFNKRSIIGLRKLRRQVRFDSLKIYDPSDTERVFANKTLPQLIFESALFKICSYSVLVQSASSILQSNVPVISPLARLVVRRYVFPHFVSGEYMADTTIVSLQMLQSANVTTILDHNVEEKETEDAWDLNLRNKLEHFEKLRVENKNSTVRFVPLKPTALMSPKLLETMTSELESGKDDKTVIARLSAADALLLKTGLERLGSICRAAQELKLGVLLDAEQTYRQPAIEVIARQLSKTFNVGGAVVVFNTYQMYLKRTSDALKRDVVEAEKGGYILAVKLVRGAYMRTERVRTKTMKKPDPIHSSKILTDDAYNSATTFLLEKALEEKVAVLLATHNRQSIDHAVLTMQKLNIHPSHRLVHFGSLMGMSDNISNALGLGGYNSNKLVSFGLFDDVLPWLCRRLDENNDALGAMQGERHLYNKEIKRRLRSKLT